MANLTAYAPDGSEREVYVPGDAERAEQELYDTHFQIGWNAAGKGEKPTGFNDAMWAGYDAYVESHAALDGVYAS